MPAGAAIFALVARTIISTAIAAIVSRALTAKPKAAAAQPLTGIKDSLRTAIAPRRLIYGRARVGGIMVAMFQIRADRGTPQASSDNAYIPFVLCQGPIDSVETCWFNDVPLGTGRFSASSYVVYDGTQTAADPTLLAVQSQSATGSGWTPQHVLSGIAYASTTVAWNVTEFPGGLPNVSFLVKGRICYDPRTGLNAWSANPAICILDYLLSELGLGATLSEVDTDSFIAAANLCDEPVVTLGGTATRYTCNGVVSLDEAPRAILEGLLSCCDGMLTYSGGKYILRAGGYEAPSWALDEDDLAAPVQIDANIPRRERYSRVRGTFVSANHNYIATDFPSVGSPEFTAADLGAEAARDIALPFTATSAMAQRIATIMLRRAQLGVSVVFPAKLSALPIQPGDVVSVTLDYLGWDAKVFRVLGIEIDPSGPGVNLELQEESPDLWNWSLSDEQAIAAADSSQLPDPQAIAAPGVPSIAETLYETSGSAGVKTRVDVSWAASGGPYLAGHDFDWDGQMASLPRDVTSYAVLDVAPGTYTVRVRARNTLGLLSDWTSATVTVAGLAATPQDVADFALISSGGLALASWTLAPDLDVRIGGRIEIRWNPATSAVAWNDGVRLADAPGNATSVVLPLRSGTYFAKFRDSSGIYSSTAASFVATEALVTGWTTVGTLTEDPTFGGSKTNVTVSGSVLQLSSTTLFDSLAGNIDSLTGEWDALGGLSGAGTYLWTTYSDQTTSIARRIELSISAQVTDETALLDDRLGNWDSWPGLFDGDEVEGWNVTTYYATTDDDPAASPAWSGWVPFTVADAKGRAYRFKSEFTAASPQHQIKVAALEVAIREPA